MATLGERYIDGVLIRRSWKPEVGDIRPEGLEFRNKRSSGAWSKSVCNDEIRDYDIEGNEYRIPAALMPGDVVKTPWGEKIVTGVDPDACWVHDSIAVKLGWTLDEVSPVYLPPDGWVALPDDETTKEFDAWSHGKDGDIHKEPNDFVPGGMTVCKCRSEYIPNGGWILRRVECESAKRVAEVGMNTHASKESDAKSQGDAQPVAELVAWVPVKRPVEKVRTGWKYMEKGVDRIQDSDEIWEKSKWRQFGELVFGEVLRFEAPCRRPIYATPEYKTIADVPDGRVIRQGGVYHWRHNGKWLVSDKGVVGHGSPSGAPGFTVTDYVMELKEAGNE